MKLFRVVSIAICTGIAFLSGCVAAGGSSNPSCYSTTDAYVHTSIVIPTQPLVANLIQRYQGNQITIDCISFAEYGPSCGTASVPQLCSRLVSDPTAAFTCETLSTVTDYASRIIRGATDGPERIWLVKWDGTSKAVSCFPRQLDVRMLAFIENSRTSNKTVFGVLLTLCIISFLLILVALVAYIRTRVQRIDFTGATTIAGPKQVFRGPQISVDAPENLEKHVTTVILPVRDSAALNEMTTARVGELLADPNTPHRRSVIHLEDELANSANPVQRAPGGSSVRRRRASPPPPGDGIYDPQFSQRMSEARRMRGNIRRIGLKQSDDDDAVVDDIFRSNRSRGGWQQGDDYDYDESDGGFSGAASRDRPRKGGQSRQQRSNLFGAQSQFTVAGGGSEADTFSAYRSLGRNGDPMLEIVEENDGGENSRPSIGGPQGQVPGSRASIRYVPQWMQGTFGRGGVIPEAGDGSDAPETDDPVGYDGAGSVISARRRGSAGGDQQPSKRFYDSPSITGKTPIKSTPGRRSVMEGPPYVDASQQRSALKHQRSNPGARGVRGALDGDEEDDAIRRGVSFEGDYVKRAVSNTGGSRAFGGGAGGGRDEAASDNFSRNRAKVHNPALQLEKPTSAAVQRPGRNPSHPPLSGNPSQMSGGGTGGERLEIAGEDEHGNLVYRVPSAAGILGGAQGGGGSNGSNSSGLYVCDNCHERVTPGQEPFFCVATGLRHF